MEIVTAVFSMLGGLGAFLVGVKLMSDSMERLADKGMRNMFMKFSGNRFAGVGLGLAVTAIINSSSITTVMVVGFVNAGLLTLAQATSVIMGANIGSTVTAQIAALEGFSVSSFATALALFGVLLTMLSKKDRVKEVGSLIASVGVIFIGLKFTSSAMEIVSENQSFVLFLATIKSPVVLVLIGVAVTAIIQSSAATAVIVLSLVGAGITIGNGGNAPLFIILGSNIGTCITAAISAIGVQTNAKRVALIHLLFNVFGSLIFFVILSLWSTFMDDVLVTLFPGAPQTQIAMFNTFFNVLCTALFIPFVNVFVKLAQIIMPDKKQSSVAEASYMDVRFVTSPSIALTQVSKEIVVMCNDAEQALEIAIDAFMRRDTGKQQDVDDNYRKVVKHNIDITEYLIKLSANVDNVKSEMEITSYHGMLGDIVRIADLSLNIVRYVGHISEKGLVFTNAVNNEVDIMYKKIQEMYSFMIDYILTKSTALIPVVDALEDEIDEMRREFAANHITRLNDGECNPQSGGMYTNLLNNLERIADHITFVVHAGDGPKRNISDEVK